MTTPGSHEPAPLGPAIARVYRSDIVQPPVPWQPEALGGFPDPGLLPPQRNNPEHYPRSLDLGTTTSGLRHPGGIGTRYGSARPLPAEVFQDQALYRERAAYQDRQAIRRLTIANLPPPGVSAPETPEELVQAERLVGLATRWHQSGQTPRSEQLEHMESAVLTYIQANADGELVGLDGNPVLINGRPMSFDQYINLRLWLHPTSHILGTEQTEYLEGVAAGGPELHDAVETALQGNPDPEGIRLLQESAVAQLRLSEHSRDSVIRRIGVNFADGTYWRVYNEVMAKRPPEMTDDEAHRLADMRASAARQNEYDRFLGAGDGVHDYEVHENMHGTWEEQDANYLRYAMEDYYLADANGPQTVYAAADRAREARRIADLNKHYAETAVSQIRRAAEGRKKLKGYWRVYNEVMAKRPPGMTDDQADNWAKIRAEGADKAANKGSRQLRSRDYRPDISLAPVDSSSLSSWRARRPGNVNEQSAVILDRLATIDEEGFTDGPDGYRDLDDKLYRQMRALEAYLPGTGRQTWRRHPVLMGNAANSLSLGLGHRSVERLLKLAQDRIEWDAERNDHLQTYIGAMSDAYFFEDLDQNYQRNRRNVVLGSVRRSLAHDSR